MVILLVKFAFELCECKPMSSASLTLSSSQVAEYDSYTVSSRVLMAKLAESPESTSKVAFEAWYQVTGV